MIHKHEVESSMVKTLEHNSETNVMTVTFPNGQSRDYPATTEEFYALLRAPSIGSHIHKNFKGKEIR